MKEKDKNILLLACVLAAITIAIGAFGAHGLKQIASPAAVSSFETGVRYQMYHVLALLALSMIPGISSRSKTWVCYFFLFGILFFSGSIYLLALKEALPFSVAFLGPITPIGGLLLIAGWSRLAMAIFKLKRDKTKD